MATSKIPNPKAITKVGNYTHVSPHGAASSSISVTQCENIVSIQGFVSNLSSLSAGESQIGVISGVSMPPVAIRTTCRIGDQAYSSNATLCYMNISIDGKIYVSPQSAFSAGKAVAISATYVATS